MDLKKVPNLSSPRDGWSEWVPIMKGQLEPTRKWENMNFEHRYKGKPEVAKSKFLRGYKNKQWFMEDKMKHGIKRQGIFEFRLVNRECTYQEIVYAGYTYGTSDKESLQVCIQHYIDGSHSGLDKEKEIDSALGQGYNIEVRIKPCAVKGPIHEKILCAEDMHSKLTRVYPWGPYLLLSSSQMSGNSHGIHQQDSTR